MRKAKKRKKRVVRKKSSWWKFFIFSLIIFMSLGLLVNKFSSAPSRIASEEGRNNLQLGTFIPSGVTQRFSPTPTLTSTPVYTFTPTASPTPQTSIFKPTPPPPLACGIASSFVLYLGTDTNGCCVEDGAGGPNDHCCAGVSEARRDTVPSYGVPGAVIWCNAKPVIYLYPEKDTLVDVNVQVPGEISVSIPKYPVGGWKQVLAKPNGELTFQGKTYSELFYESSVTPIAPPTQGFIIQSSKVSDFLKTFSLKLGLRENESNELVSYWTPKLNDLHSPYVFISVFNPTEKEKIDHVEIAPYPDTFIQMILYFKPLSKIEQVEPPALPKVPNRIGFTAVEWGGIIDQ